MENTLQMNGVIMPEPALAVTQLASGYGDLLAIRDVSLVVNRREITALLGRNGAGKTSTLRAIAGINKVSGGSIKMFDSDMAGKPAHRRVREGLAYVQDNKRVFRGHTVAENLELGAFTSRSRIERRERLDEVFARFPVLAKRRAEPAAVLSGGQQQMLVIGRALMSSPRLLMLDEPSAGLAPAIVDEVMTAVLDLRRDGLSVLLVEQTVGLAIELADRYVVIDHGRTVLELDRDHPGAAQAVTDALTSWNHS